MSKRPAESDPPLSEKSYKKRPSVMMDATTYSVLEVVMKQPGLLHWTDLLKIGATCKEMSSLTKPLLDSSLAPLLEYLEGMCRSNVHFDRARFYAPRSMRKCQCDASNCNHDSELPQNQTLDSLDPRNKNDYESWIACKKCCAMTEFLAAVIATMQAHFDFSDPSNPKQWRSEGLLDGPQSSIFSMKHNRASLVINLAVLSIFNHAIKCGDTCTGSHYFNNDLLGNDPIDGSGSCALLPHVKPLMKCSHCGIKTLFASFAMIFTPLLMRWHCLDQLSPKWSCPYLYFVGCLPTRMVQSCFNHFLPNWNQSMILKSVIDLDSRMTWSGPTNVWRTVDFVHLVSIP